MDIGNGKLLLGDCLDLMKRLPDNSIDMILCDLPYGTTQNKWDVIVDFEDLWCNYWRVAKKNAAVVLTSQTPFDKVLGASQVEHLKYEWIWQKSKATGHLNCKKQPLKNHENILVFYKNPPKYRPQMIQGKKYKPSGGKSKKDNYGDFKDIRENDGSKRYPKSILEFTVESGLHPTQKPVNLFEYLIKTYTDKGDTVLDNCSGSGTTAIAAERTGRRWVCMEKNDDYYFKSMERIINETERKKMQRT